MSSQIIKETLHSTGAAAYNADRESFDAMFFSHSNFSAPHDHELA
jgi:hypothetical protein